MNSKQYEDNELFSILPLLVHQETRLDQMKNQQIEIEDQLCAPNPALPTLRSKGDDFVHRVLGNMKSKRGEEELCSRICDVVPRAEK
jgi:hypothetical protein